MDCDVVFVTHLPSFYKINLYNSIAKKRKIFVIFISSGSVIRNADFTNQPMLFDYIILNEGDFETRSIIKSSYLFLKAFYKIKYKQIIVGGWDLIEFWVVALLGAKSKNSVIVESSVFESPSSGIKKQIKHFFLSQFSVAYCSGQPHIELIQTIGFSGKIIKTLGVGLRNCAANVQRRNPQMEYKRHFVYIGRLSPEKNINFLVDVFNRHTDYSLTLIGDGPLFDHLQTIAGPNVKLAGYVKNTDLGSLMQEFDVFILPSLSEPWGLVVEEAISFGLPILCSDRVGCSQDVVIQNQLGLEFDPHSESSLLAAITDMEENFSRYITNVSGFNIDTLANHQVDSYLSHES